MPESRHKTTLEVGVEDRQVKQLGDDIKRSFDPKAMEAFERATERVTRALKELDDRADRAGESTKGIWAHIRSQEGRQGGAGGRGGGGGAPGGGGGSEGRTSPAAGSAAGRVGLGAGIGSYLGTRLGGLGRMAPTQEGFFAQALSGIPLFGPALSGAISSANNYYQQFAGFEKARVGQFGRTALGRGQTSDLVNAGVNLGMGPNETVGMLPEFAQQTGMRGEQLGRAAPSLMELQRLMGITQGGSIVGAAGASGGEVEDPKALIFDAVSSGLQSGVREARLDQFLQQVASFTEQARMEGINIQSDSILSLTRGISQLGPAFQGRGGAQLAQNMAQGLRGAAEKNDAFSFMAMRAAGFGRGKSLMETKLALEENPEQVIPELMRMIRERGQGGSRESRAFFLQSGMRSLGVNLSSRRALRLAGMSPEDLRGLQQGGDDMRFPEQDVAARLAQRREEAALGVAKTEAGFERRRIGVGGRVAEDVVRLRDFEMGIVEKVVPPLMDISADLAEFVDKGIENIGKIMSGDMDIGDAVLKQLGAGDVGKAINEYSEWMEDLSETIEKAIKDGLAAGFEVAGFGKLFRAMGMKNPFAANMTGGGGGSDRLRNASRELALAADELDRQGAGNVDTGMG